MYNISKIKQNKSSQVFVALRFYATRRRMPVAGDTVDVDKKYSLTTRTQNLYIYCHKSRRIYKVAH